MSIYNMKMQELDNNIFRENDYIAKSNNENEKKRKIQIWTLQEDEQLRNYQKIYPNQWHLISKFMVNRNHSQCKQRFYRLRPKIKKQKWTKQEDKLLENLVIEKGKNWKYLKSYFKDRSCKQIRERFINVLDQNINKNKWTEEEDNLIINQYILLGSKWCQISKMLQGRPDNKVKNRFHKCLKEKFFGNQNKTQEENLQLQTVKKETRVFDYQDTIRKNQNQLFQDCENKNYCIDSIHSLKSEFLSYRFFKQSDNICTSFIYDSFKKGEYQFKEIQIKEFNINTFN